MANPCLLSYCIPASNITATILIVFYYYYIYYLRFLANSGKNVVDPDNNIHLIKVDLTPKPRLYIVNYKTNYLFIPAYSIVTAKIRFVHYFIMISPLNFE